MHVELQDQPLVTEEIDEQVQDAANVGYQEGLLPEEETIEEQWRLRDNVMAAFNATFEGYKMINDQIYGHEQAHRWNPSALYGANIE